MAESNEHNAMGSAHRTPSEAERNLTEINTWRTTKVDPMLDRHQKILVDGDAGFPSVTASILTTNLKLDYNNQKQGELVFLAKLIAGLVIFLGGLITIIDFAGPWLRQKFGMPITYVMPAPTSTESGGKYYGPQSPPK